MNHNEQEKKKNIYIGLFASANEKVDSEIRTQVSCLPPMRKGASPFFLVVLGVNFEHLYLIFTIIGVVQLINTYQNNIF